MKQKLTQFKSGQVRRNYRAFLLPVLLVLMGVLSARQAKALVSNYQFVQSMGTFTQITGTTLFSNGWQNNVNGSVSIGFTFNFDGTNYTTCAVSSNGFISFGTTIPSTTNYTPISSTQAYAGCIAGFGFSLYDYGWYPVTYSTTGTAPNRVFTVQWYSTARAQPAYWYDDMHMQIKLYETTNRLEVVYSGPYMEQYSSQNTCQVGLRGATNADYNNRSSTYTSGNWSTSVAGTSNTASMANNYSGSSAYTIPSGLTFAWVPPCAGTPTAGTASANNTTYNCQGAPTLNLPTATVAGGMQYQWQSRPVGGTTWSNLGTVQTTIPYTLGTPITASTEFRAWVRCTVSNMTDTSTPVTVNIVGTTITPATTTNLCTPPGSQVLSITAPALADTLFKENFNGTTHQMIITNNTNSSGTGWKKSTNGSEYDNQATGYTFTSGSGDFMITYMWTSGSTSQTYMETPSFNTNGYTSLSLSYRTSWYYGTTSWPSRVEVSTNGGSSWTQVGTSYGSTQVGTWNNFTGVTVNLNSYINQANVKLRFYSDYGTYQYWSRVWAVDDIAITGAHPPLAYSWTASPSSGSGLPSGAGTPSLTNSNITITPGVGTFTYTAAVSGQGVGCATTKQVIVNANPKPSATLSLANASICDGGATTLGITFTNGVPPFTLTYTDGVTSTTTTTTNTTLNIPINPNTTRTYKITALSDPNCTADSAQIPDSAVLTVHPRPTAAMNNQSYNICDGSTALLPVTLTGTPPFSITYYDGTNYTTLNNIMTTSYMMPVPTVLGTTTYVITNLNDYNCAALPGDISGSNTVSAYIRPTATISGNPTICNGTPGTVLVTFGQGNPPYSFTYSDGGSFTYSVSNVLTNPYTLTVTPANTATYTLTTVSDVNCSTLPQDLSGASLVTVNTRPTATVVNNPQTICHGDPVNLTVNFTGTPPYTFMYTNGQGTSLISGVNTSSYTFSTTPQATGSYTVSALNDANCVAFNSDLTGSSLVTVRHPAAAISGTQVSCNGGTSDLTVDFSGPGLTAPYTFTYSDGNQTNTVTTSSDPYALTVNTSGSSTFTLTAFNDANCIGDISGAATIVANPQGGWNGMTSSDWHNPANWCGGIPTNTTDVVIPAAAPNQPVLSSGNGFTRTLTVDPGASMTIVNGANYFLYGDLMANGMLNWANGNVNLVGAVPQTVDGFTSQNLLVGNGSQIYPTQDITVTAVMQLAGNIYLNSSNLVMKPGSQILGYEETQYVHTLGTGTLVRPVSAFDVIFPVGNSTYNPITLNNVGVPDDFSVRVVDQVYADGYGVNPAVYHYPRVTRTWMVGEGTAGGSDVTMTPTWYNHPGEEATFFDRTKVFVRHWDGTQWVANDSLNAGPCGGYGTFGPYTATGGGYTSFSPFSVGSWNMWPLAIELLDFKAQLQDNNNALLNWNITQSSDADRFEIERSVDGAEFIKVGEVAGIETKTAYNMVDRGLAIGKNFYRLKIWDKSGKSAYSNVAVVVTKGLGVEVVSLSPNPVTGVGTVAISSDNATEAQVKILDAVGREMYTGTHTLTQGMNKVNIDMNTLPQGNYTLHVMTNSGNSTPVKFTKL